MVREAVLLVGASMALGLSCFYWKNEPAWCIPLLPMLFNSTVLYIVIGGWFRKSTVGTSVFNSIFRAAIWLGSVSYMIIVNGYIEAWKYEILEYACMQPVTPEMEAVRREHWNFINGAQTTALVEISSVLIAINLILIVVALVFGSASGEKLSRFLKGWKDRPIRYSLIVLGSICILKPVVYFLEILSLCSLPLIMK